MKSVLRISVAFYLLLGNSQLLAQGTEFFSSIGPFEIGGTTPAVVDSIAASRGVVVRAVSLRSDVKPTDGSFKAVELLYDASIPQPNRPIRASACPRVRVFELDEVTVAGVSMRGVRLTFFNGKLARLYCDYSHQLEDAMKAMFGKPLSYSYDYTGECKRKKDRATTSEWEGYCNKHGISGRITVINAQSKDCKTTRYHFFEMDAERLIEEIDECEALAKQMEDPDSPARKREALKRGGF